MRVESGIAHIWDQYNRNEKVQKLMGKDLTPAITPATTAANSLSSPNTASTTSLNSKANNAKR